MIRGSDIHVEPASESNGYIELPAGVTHPWSKLGECEIDNVPLE